MIQKVFQTVVFLLVSLYVGCDKDSDPQISEPQEALTIHVDSNTEWWLGYLDDEGWHSWGGTGDSVIVTDTTELCIEFELVNQNGQDLEQGEYVRVWFTPNGGDSVVIVHNPDFPPELSKTVCGSVE